MCKIAFKKVCLSSLTVIKVKSVMYVFGVSPVTADRKHVNCRDRPSWRYRNEELTMFAR